MMEAVHTSETSVSIYLTTQQHIPEDSELIKISSSSEDPSEYKISWPYVDWCKFFIHLRSSNARHFGLVTDTALEIHPFVPLQRRGCLGAPLYILYRFFQI
jgi:hypothetical protein